MVEWYIFRTALRDLLQPRRVFVAALLAVGPGAVALIIRIALQARFDGVSTYGALASLLVFGFVLPILAVVFGTGVISQEMEQKTIVYLLTRPVARWRILLAKFAAAWLVISATTALSTVVLALVSHQPGKGSGQFRLYPDALTDAKGLCERLQLPQDPLSEYLRSRLAERTRQSLDRWDPGTRPRPDLVQGVVNDLNAVIERDRTLYDSGRFAAVRLPEDARQLLAEKPRGEARTRLNRWLLEAALPDLIPRSRTTVGQVPRDILILPVGALAYGSICLLLATLLSRALIVGLFLSFGWESWVPMLPGNFRLVSIMTYLRALAPHARPETADVDVMSIFTALNPESVPALLSWLVLACVSFGALVLAVGVFSFREYSPKDDTM